MRTIEEILIEISNFYNEIEEIFSIYPKYDVIIDGVRKIQLVCIRDSPMEILLNIIVDQENRICISKMDVFGEFIQFNEVELRFLDIVGLDLCNKFKSETNQNVTDWWENESGYDHPITLVKLIVEKEIEVQQFYLNQQIVHNIEGFVSKYKNREKYRHLVDEFIGRDSELTRQKVYSSIGMSKTTFSNFYNYKRKLTNRNMVLKIIIGLKCRVEDGIRLMKSVGLSPNFNYEADAIVFYALHNKVDREKNLRQVDSKLILEFVNGELINRGEPKL